MKVLAILLVPMFLMAQMVAGSKSDISTDNRLTVYSSRCERDCVCAKCHSEKILMPFPPRDVSSSFLIHSILHATNITFALVLRRPCQWVVTFFEN